MHSVPLDGSKRPEELFSPEGHGRAAAGSFFRDCTGSHPPSSHQSPLRHRETPLFHAHACTETHAEGKKIPWVSQTEIPRKTLSSHRVTAVVAQINKQHALGQGHHRMSIACLHFHLKPSAGTCYLQTLARIKTIPSTRSTAPCEPAV